MIELNGETFRIHRTETSATISLEGSSTPIAAGKDPVTQYVVQQLGMTYDEFCSTYLSAQKDIERIATLRPAVVFEELAPASSLKR